MAGLLLMAFSWPGASQQVLPLSMKQAVNLALEPDGSVRVQLAREAIRQAESRKKQALAALLPHVDGYVQYDDRVVNLEAFGVKFGLPGTPLQTPSKVGPFTVFDARAQGTQTIFSLSAIRRYQAAREQVRVARDEDDSTRDKVAGQVAQAYLAALRAQARLEAAKANVKLAQALLDLAVHQKEVGTGTGIDVTRAKVQLSNEKQLLLVAQNDRRRANLELLRAMDLRLETNLELTDQLIYHPIELTEARRALEEALVSRADWKAQLRRQKSAELIGSATKWERLPSIAAFGNYGSMGNEINGSFPTRTYGVRMTVPVFDGGRMDARRAETASLLRQAKIGTADLRSRIEMEIRLALDGLRSTADQVKVAEAGLKLAENEMAQAQRRFRAGVTNSVEVTDAQNRIARARDNRIAALYNYERARLEYGQAIGKIREMVE